MGKIDASTTGVIVTTKTTNPTDGIVKGVANLAGKGAELWVKAKVAKGAFSKISSPLASGAGALVKKGVSSLLGSFTGAFNSKGETTQSVQLNTEAEVGLVGEIKTQQTGLIKPLSMSIAPSYVGRLGAWCMTEEPRMLLYPYTIYEERDNLNPEWFKYSVYPRFDFLDTQHIVINPEVQSEISSVSYSIDTYMLASNTKYQAFGNFLGGTSYIAPRIGEELYEGIYAPNYKYTLSVPLYDRYGHIFSATDLEEDDVPYEVFVPTAPNGVDGIAPRFNCTSAYVLVFNVTFTTKSGDTVCSSHTFIPHFEWEPFGDDTVYLDLYPTVPIDKIATY